MHTAYVQCNWLSLQQKRKKSNHFQDEDSVLQLSFYSPPGFKSNIKKKKKKIGRCLNFNAEGEKKLYVIQ